MEIRQKKNINRLRGILFDLDGTILDSMSWHIRAWQDILTSQGLEVEDELLYLNEGAIESSHLMEVIEKQGPAPEAGLIQTLLDRQAKHFKADFARFVVPFPDARAALDRFREMNLELALITSSSRPVVDRILKTELRQRFSAIVTGDEVENGKPDPEPYLTGLDKLGLRKDDCLAVENAPAGIRSAKAAGLTCAALTTTLSESHLKEADLVFGSLAQLTDHFACGKE